MTVEIRSERCAWTPAPSSPPARWPGAFDRARRARRSVRRRGRGAGGRDRYGADHYEGVTSLEAVKDRRSREGHGVDIPTGGGVVRVIFDRDTSELLEWSEPGETHTFLQAGHVAKLGERP